MILLSIIFPRMLGRLLIPLLIATTLMVGVHSLAFAQAEEFDPPEITNGERLFLETRFAQFFKTFLESGKGVNDTLTDNGGGDPTLDTAVNWALDPSEFEEGPFAGQSMNCRSCHFVDELGVEEEIPGYGMRTYTDFARRSPVPAREDGKTVTVRNSPPLVNASLRREFFFLHFDAEFPTMVDLVIGTLTGRNYGYLPGEEGMAIAHTAKVVREDNGLDNLAAEFGSLSYSVLLTGTDPNIPEEFRLPAEFRVDVTNASDEEIFQAVTRLIAAYTEDLAFSQDDDGNFNLSPYDVWLELNNLPQQPRRGESDLRYSQRLLALIERQEERGQLQYVSENPATDDGKFLFHDQDFVFGKEELKGLKIFFAQKRRLRPKDLEAGKTGNCIGCHAAPNFSDFRFHNTGITQEEYDGIHAPGAFSRLSIPNLTTRNRNYDQYLPATTSHPNAKEPFRSIPSVNNKQLADLGLWNIAANPDFPNVQREIWELLCEDRDNRGECRRSGNFRRLLSKTIALFKTPGLRDGSHSAPYFHNGHADTFENVIESYIHNSNLAREGHLRNSGSRLGLIALTEDDIAPLAAFLRALNEDYE